MNFWNKGTKWLILSFLLFLALQQYGQYRYNFAKKILRYYSQETRYSPPSAIFYSAIDTYHRLYPFRFFFWSPKLVKDYSYEDNSTDVEVAIEALDYRQQAVTGDISHMAYGYSLAYTYSIDKDRDCIHDGFYGALEDELLNPDDNIVVLKEPICPYKLEFVEESGILKEYHRRWKEWFEFRAANYGDSAYINMGDIRFVVE